jgi:predicted nucleotidyltransferase
MGSQCYGVSTKGSDWDMVGWCVPPKDMVFPHLAGVIPGFGRQIQKFVCYQQHHVKVPPREYDLNCYNIVHYFHLCMENNPNMVDSLFVPRECIVHSSSISEMVRESRKLFLHKGAWHKFKGYAYSQLHKMSNKKPEGKRLKSVQKFGFDVKFAYHTVRLLGEVEQILEKGDIDLRRNREHLKAIRRGEVSEEDIRRWAADKEHHLEKLYATSPLRHKPDEPAIKQLLLDCLEQHYGSLDGCLVADHQPVHVLRSIADIIDKNRGLLG